jgi:Icc-related predicted phosphoesterase
MPQNIFNSRIVILLLLIFISLAARGREQLAEPALTRGPYLQSVTTSGIVIRWRTDAMERGVVHYGTEPGKLDMRSESKEIALDHIIMLKDLNPSTRYYYSIGGLTHILQGDKDNYFITLPAQGSSSPVRIAAFGDCGNNSVNQKQVRDQVLNYSKENPLNAWLLLGDNAYESGTDAEYGKNFFGVYKEDLLKNLPLFPTPGNHDYRDIDKYRGKSQQSQEVAYYKNFTMPVKGEAGGVPSNNPAYYSFDIGNVHFLSLDSYGKDIEGNRMYDTLSAQVQWVKKDLEANRNRGWVIAYWHHPPYTMTSHNSDKETELVKIREQFVRILERLGVDLVLCGHSHAYERTRLIKGHFGSEASFSPELHNQSLSSALYDGSDNSCPYIKNQPGDGIVYVVSGSAGKIDSNTQKTFPHDAMYYSNPRKGGAFILEARGNRLDLQWLCADGVTRDRFTMMKGVNRTEKTRIRKGEAVVLTASFEGVYNWNRSKQKSRSITITPPPGRTVYTVQDQYQCVKDIFEVEVIK